MSLRTFVLCPSRRLALILLLLGACQTDPEDAGPVAHGEGGQTSQPDGGKGVSPGTPVTDAGPRTDAGPTDMTGPDESLEPGTKVTLSLSQADQAELATLNAELDTFAGLTPAALLEKHPIQFTQTLGYDPRQAKNVDLIQASPFKLTDAELQKLGSQGFVITPRNQFPHMLYGYQSIYAADLPVYISLDSILDAVHVSYDRILASLETSQLSLDLGTMLREARSHLQDATLDSEVARDLDVYFSAALSLLEPTAQAPVFAENAALLSQLVKKALAADGFQEVELFGVKRDMDFSQFKPRGHYTASPELERYFRAMIWLGRTDFRIIETLGDGSSVFRRRQLEAVLALASVVTGKGRAAYDRIDQAVTAFVGEHDYMQLAEVDLLLADLGGAQAVSSQSDNDLAQLIIQKGYGAQRIASQVIFKDSASAAPLPLGRSFALLGQRYAVDSEVFSNVVFDRVPAGPNGTRGLPNPLDAAYAALHNAAALPLLRDELERYPYATHLERMHALVEAHGDAYWGENLYNLWLSTLRAVSPAEGAQDPTAEGKPAVTGTEAWSRRLLNTQLASWAELRHDTILYVKQSYSVGVSCEFPDGYVDPYPEAFARLEAFAMKGHAITALFDDQLADSARLYFENLAQISALLRSMAEQQKTGVPFGADQLAFLNDAVRMQLGQVCGAPPTYEGWYTRLLFGSSEDMDPTIADVHTDAGDNRPPRALHVATGLPRLMVVTRESCSGPRAYVGLAFAYHEIVKDLPRLSDEDWAPLAPMAEDVTFMKPILP